jgi:hypothetical protein
MPKRNEPQEPSPGLTEEAGGSAKSELSTAQTTPGAYAETQANTEGGAVSCANVAVAYNELVREEQQAGLEYQRQCSEAYFVLVNSHQQAHWEANKPVEEARRRVMISCSGPQTPESWEKCQQAYQELAGAESELANNRELQDQLLKAHSAYLRANIEAAKKAQDRCIRAYWTYLDALKNAWATGSSPG